MIEVPVGKLLPADTALMPALRISALANRDRLQGKSYETRDVEEVHLITNRRPRPHL